MHTIPGTNGSFDRSKVKKTQWNQSLRTASDLQNLPGTDRGHQRERQRGQTGDSRGQMREREENSSSFLPVLSGAVGTRSGGLVLPGRTAHPFQLLRVLPGGLTAGSSAPARPLFRGNLLGACAVKPGLQGGRRARRPALMVPNTGPIEPGAIECPVCSTPRLLCWTARGRR